MNPPEWKTARLDDVPVGTMVYSVPGVVLGVVEVIRTNESPARGLNNGHSPHLYQRIVLYNAVRQRHGQQVYLAVYTPQPTPVPKPKPVPKCACGEISAGLCAWKVDRFVRATYRDVEVGDRVKRVFDQTGRPPATVRGKTTVDERAKRAIGLNEEVLSIVLLIRGVERIIGVCARSPVAVERQVPCKAAACERHLRRVDDELIYCQDHWRSWEEVA
jgi:hypothetical protein